MAGEGGGTGYGQGVVESGRRPADQDIEGAGGGLGEVAGAGPRLRAGLADCNRPRIGEGAGGEGHRAAASGVLDGPGVVDAESAVQVEGSASDVAVDGGLVRQGAVAGEVADQRFAMHQQGAGEGQGLIAVILIDAVIGRRTREDVAVAAPALRPAGPFQVTIGGAARIAEEDGAVIGQTVGDGYGGTPGLSDVDDGATGDRHSGQRAVRGGGDQGIGADAGDRTAGDGSSVEVPGAGGGAQRQARAVVHAAADIHLRAVRRVGDQDCLGGGEAATEIEGGGAGQGDVALSGE